MTPIHGCIKEADYVAAQWLHIKPRPAFAVVGCLLLILALVLFIRTPDWRLAVGLSIVVGGLFIARPYQARRTFRQWPSLTS